MSMITVLRQVYLTGQPFRGLNGPGSRPAGRGESNFRIEIFKKNQYEQKGELGKQLPELVLLSVLILLEYFYTKIRFSTPGILRIVTLIILGRHEGKLLLNAAINRVLLYLRSCVSATHVLL